MRFIFPRGNDRFPFLDIFGGEWSKSLPGKGFAIFLSFIEFFQQRHFFHDRGVRIFEEEHARKLKEEVTEKKGEFL